MDSYYNCIDNYQLKLIDIHYIVILLNHFYKHINNNLANLITIYYYFIFFLLMIKM